MVRRRTVFSTPFVVVLGCSQPAERPVAPGSGARGSDTQVAAPHDANEESDEEKIARIKAGFMDAQQPCVQSLDNRAPKCNPPAPDAWVAQVLDAQIVNVNPSASGVSFVAKIGDSSAVDSSWSGVFVDDSGPIVGSDFKIVESQVAGAYIKGFLAGRKDVPSRRVRFANTQR